MAGYPWRLVWLLLYLAGVASGLKVVQLEAGDGQGFADAIAAFGTSGEDTTIKLPYGRVFSVANATIVSAQGSSPFSAGVLTIEPSDRPNGAQEAFTVLDAGMRSGLVSFNGTPSGFTGSARLQLNNIVMINLCDVKLALEPRYPYLYQRTVYNMALFGIRSAVFTAHFYNHLTQYARQADVAATTWLAMSLRLPPHFYRRAERFGAWTRLTGLAWFDLSTAHAFLGGYKVPGAVNVNASFKSITDPDDPLLASLRAEGRLMEPRYCDGDASPPPLLVDPFMPAWLTADTTGWLGAVAQASKRAAEPNTTFAVPGIVVLVGSALPFVPKSSLSVTPLQGPLLLSGPLNDEPGVVAEGVLDLTGSERPLIQVAPNGLLFIQQMKLKGLAARPLPQPASSAGGSDAARPRSVFPLSAFPLANSSSAIWMYNVTLVLPTADYLALLTLALQGDTASISGCVNASTRAHAAALQAGISALSLQQAEPGYSSFSLSSFAGWGVNVSGLELQPADPTLPYQLWLVCRPAAAAAQAQQSCDSSGLTTQEIAIIAGCAVAGLVLLLAMLGMVVWWQTRSSTARNTTSLVEDGHAGAGKQADSSTTGAGTNYGWVALSLDPSTPPLGRSPDSVGKESVSGEANVVQESIAPFLGLPQHACGVAPADVEATTNNIIGAVSSAPAPKLQSQSKRSLQQVVSTAEIALASTNIPNGSRMGQSQGNGQAEAKTVVTLSKEVPKPAMRDAEVQVVRSNDDAGQEHDSFPSHATVTTPDPRAAIDQLVDEMASGKDTVMVEAVLGTGSWGTVYRGIWRGLQVALKTLVFEVEEGSSSGQSKGSRTGVTRQQRAVTEAAVAASVDHRNLVRTYHYDIKAVHSKEQPGDEAGSLQIDMVENEGGYKEFKLFLVQELCALPLSQALTDSAMHDENTGLVESSAVLVLLLDIAEGLAYLHGRNIIHGDLKPANVLLKSSDTPTGVVAKLTDFGLSVRMTGGATHVSNHRGGTPFYVAPEVIDEYRTSTASDVYSFGILMWQLYSGLLPYQCSATGEFHWNPVFPTFQSPNIPCAQYMFLTHRCLLRDPRQRPTATQLMAHLQQIQGAATPAAL